MIFQNDQYRIIAQVEYRPPLSSFDVVHNTEKINTDDHYSARVFRIERSDAHTITIALPDLICSTHEPYAVLSERELTVLLFDSIVRIDLDTGSLLQRAECGSMGGLYEIHPVDGGYIIWGESEIFRYDLNLNKVWLFSGNDMLVSSTHNRHFWIEDSMIHCRDFEGWHYILNLDGKLINRFPD